MSCYLHKQCSEDGMSCVKLFESLSVCSKPTDLREILCHGTTASGVPKGGLGVQPPLPKVRS
jgi:hypothetical protein